MLLCYYSSYTSITLTAAAVLTRALCNATFNTLQPKTPKQEEHTAAIGLYIHCRLCAVIIHRKTRTVSWARGCGAEASAAPVHWRWKFWNWKDTKQLADNNCVLMFFIRIESVVRDHRIGGFLFWRGAKGKVAVTFSPSFVTRMLSGSTSKQQTPRS